MTLPTGLSEMDVKGTLDGLAKALGVEGRIDVNHFTPRGYDIIMSEDYKPLLLLPSDDILGSEALFKKNFDAALVEATISIRCTEQAWMNLVKGARL